MSYPSTNGPMSLAAAGMATCVKPTPLPSSAAGFVKVESGGAYYGGGYGLAHAAVADSSAAGGGGGGGSTNSLSSCSSASSSFCLSSLPFSHEGYQLAAAAGHTQTPTGPLLAAVDANIRQFSTPTSAAIPYITCDQCAPSGSGGSSSAVPHHPTVLYNWAAAHQPVPMGMGSTTVLNHASYGGLMAAHTPSPPPSQCGTSASPTTVEHCTNAQTSTGGGDSLQEQESTRSPQESGYCSGATSPAPIHHRYV